MDRFSLTEYEKSHLRKECPKCGSSNLDPAKGWNSADGMIKCYDCGWVGNWLITVEAEG